MPLDDSMKRINCTFNQTIVQKLKVFAYSKGITVRAAIRMIVNDFLKDKSLY
jgi:hypothetical protein